jgi:hypothetical protein
MHMHIYICIYILPPLAVFPLTPGSVSVTVRDIVCGTPMSRILSPNFKIVTYYIYIYICIYRGRGRQGERERDRGREREGGRRKGGRERDRGREGEGGREGGNSVTSPRSSYNTVCMHACMHLVRIHVWMYIYTHIHTYVYPAPNPLSSTFFAILVHEA